MKKKIKIKDIPAGKKAMNIKGGLTGLTTYAKIQTTMTGTPTIGAIKPVAINPGDTVL